MDEKNKKIKRPLLEVLRKKPKRFLAVDFGQGVIKMAYLASSATHLKLLAFDIHTVSSTDEKDSKGIVDLINQFIKKNVIKEKDIKISISDTKTTIIKYLVMPVLPENEILGAAKWSLREEVPFDVEQAHIDWQILKEFTDDEGAKKKGILFVAAQKEAVDQYLSIISQCRLNLLGITNEAFNFAHILKYLPEKPKISAILNIDMNDTTLNMYMDGQLYFVRRLPTSWEKFTLSMTKFLMTEKGRIELSHKEAEEIKNNFGIPLNPNQEIQGNIQARHILALMRPVLETLILELKLSFDYFKSNFDSQLPSHLYLTGFGANLKNLDQYLKKEFNFKISCLPMPAYIDKEALKEKAPNQEDQNKLMSVIGTALSDAKTIDLVPLKIKREKAEYVQKAYLRLISISMGAIFLILLFIAGFQVKDYQNRLSNAQRHLQTIGKYGDLKQKIDSRQAIIKGVQDKRIPVDGMLKVISLHIPPEVTLDTLLFNQAGNSVVAKGIVAAAENATEFALTHFMRQLEDSSFFSEVSLVSFKRAGAVQEFELRCDLIQP